MAKNKPAGKKPLTPKEQLAAGAEAIRAARAEKQQNAVPQGAAKPAANKSKKSEETPPATPPLTPVVFAPVVESTRDIGEILAERVEIKDNIAVTIKDETPLEECLPILDYFTNLGEHVGFMIGDVINHCQSKFGAKYDAAMAATGRSNVTLRSYVHVAKQVPPELRKAALSFSAHREVARITDTKKKAKVLDDAAKLAEKGKAPTKLQIREVVNKVEPPKPKTPPKKGGKGKAKKKKGAKETPPYEVTAEDQAQLDDLTEKADALLTLVRDDNLKKLVFKIANDRKRELSEILDPIAKFAAEVEKHTGY